MFNFDQLAQRRGTSCVKWDEAAPDELPLWVADMDFEAAPVIGEAIRRRADHLCYGYTFAPDAYYDAIIDWQRRRYDWHIERHHIINTIGVVPALAAALKAITQPGDTVATFTPAYNCFFSCIRNAGCECGAVRLVECPMADQPRVVQFAIDWAALEQQLAGPKCTVLLLCNPHNPTGHRFTREELLRIGDLCRQHGVTVVSDEIHGPLTPPGEHYTPWGTLGKAYQTDAIICTAASKSFNIAGLQNAQLVVSNGPLRRRVDRQINIYETCDCNPFGYAATTAAYSPEGEAWFDALRAYLWDNYLSARDYLLRELPGVRVADLQSTYLMWVDVSAYASNVEDLGLRLRREAKVWFAAGTVYGADGEGWLRINLATSRQVLTEALRRFVEYLR